MKHLVIATIFAAILCAGFALGRPQNSPPSSNSNGSNTAPAGAVDDTRCRSCHKAEFTKLGKTIHASSGCEKCHGSGTEHADAEESAHGDEAKTLLAKKLIFSFRGNSKENSARCLGCHQAERLQQNFAHSEHSAHGVSCNSCHSPHLVNEVRDQSKGEQKSVQARIFQVYAQPDEPQWLRNSLLKSAQPELCYTCHGTIQAKFALPVHHRVAEGLMKCSDCHNTHDSSNHASLISKTSETCVQCHSEKRGPFLHEHPAGKIDGCITCHDPHGSVNRNLLVRREGRELCLQCHIGFHGQAAVPHSKLSFQTSGECVRCHVAIHGSSFDVNFLR